MNTEELQQLLLKELNGKTLTKKRALELAIFKWELPPKELYEPNKLGQDTCPLCWKYDWNCVKFKGKFIGNSSSCPLYNSRYGGCCHEYYDEADNARVVGDYFKFLKGRRKLINFMKSKLK